MSVYRDQDLLINLQMLNNMSKIHDLACVIDHLSYINSSSSSKVLKLGNELRVKVAAYVEYSASYEELLILLDSKICTDKSSFITKTFKEFIFKRVIFNKNCDILLLNKLRSIGYEFKLGDFNRVFCEFEDISTTSASIIDLCKTIKKAATVFTFFLLGCLCLLLVCKIFAIIQLNLGNIVIDHFAISMKELDKAILRLGPPLLSFLLIFFISDFFGSSKREHSKYLPSIYLYDKENIYLFDKLLESHFRVTYTDHVGSSR